MSRVVSSLRARIVALVMGLVVATTLSILLYEHHATVSSMTAAQEESARNLVKTVALSVESQHRSIERLKQAAMSHCRETLRSTVGQAALEVKAAFEAFERGAISEHGARRRAIEAVERLPCDASIGLWINTTDQPTPRMMMHGTRPELSGQPLDHAFRAVADMCLRDGRGYVDYLSTESSADGNSDPRPTLAYAELFAPWGWVIGAELEVDDIERDEQQRIRALVNELKRPFSRVKVAETGYMFLFNGRLEMLIHPTLVGPEFAKLISPTTGNPILEDLMQAAHSPERNLSYVWGKPPDLGDASGYQKVAFVEYFAPLDWYIASSVYRDEMERPAIVAGRRIMAIGLLLVVGSLVLSLWLASSLARPLRELSRAARRIRGEGQERVPVSGTVETRELGEVLNSMVDSLRGEIAVRREAEATLSRALQEKEVLLREVHHRVKNNLAVVMSLLNMQARRVGDGDACEALGEARSRVSAMALIHETLYRSKGLARIPLQRYLKALFRAVQDLMRDNARVRFEVAGDAVELSVEKAVPCGLVLNELITNSLKHGYPAGHSGTIRVTACADANGWLELDYSDDGVGLPAAFDSAHQGTLGMRVVRLLVLNQLGGELVHEPGPGARFIMRWPMGAAGVNR